LPDNYHSSDAAYWREGRQQTLVSLPATTDQNDVGEVDDDDGGRDEQLSTLKVLSVEHDGQREGDGAAKSAVRHDEMTDAVQLRHSDQIREVVQNNDHWQRAH